MDLAVSTFVVIPVLLVAALIWGTFVSWRRTGATPARATRAATVVATIALVWMTSTWAAAQSGILQRWDRNPPPFGLLVAGIVTLSLAAAFSGFGRRLARGIPLWILVAVQGFRLPLELAMHAMYERGVMPPEMTYTGRNFDIITGASAIVVAAVLARGRGGRAIVAGWNLLGLALLINVVIVAILGTPRFRYFGDDHLNVWVTYPPFVWLPAIMVLFALAGHFVIFRALRLRHP
jgi:hypothetical protein